MRTGFGRRVSAIAIGLLSGWGWALPTQALCEAEFSAAIESLAQRPELSRARLGVQIETLDGEVLYSREGDRFFVPASTLKLVTSAAVLTRLGPDFTVKTTVHPYPLPMEDPHQAQTLVVIGRGDPSFNQASMTTLAQQLARRGVRHIPLLWGDEGTFRGEAISPDWDWEDVQAGYGAPVNALIFEENQIGFRLVPQALGEPLRILWDDPTQGQGWQIENRSRTVAPGEPEFVQVGRDWRSPVIRISGQLVMGAEPETASVSVPNPGEAFLQALQRALAQQGIRVDQTHLLPQDWHATTNTLPLPTLATVESPPVSALLLPMNQDSNNLYAEALLKQLGTQTAPTLPATEAGIQAVLDSLRPLGLDPADIVMVDGSGLARKNLITPAAMVSVLQGMARSPHAAFYRDSLAVAGESGTLRHRWRDTPIAGHLWGKSGAISRNFALAGYLETPSSGSLVIGIFINNIDAGGATARSLIDEIVWQIFQLTPCPGSTDEAN